MKERVLCERIHSLQGDNNRTLSTYLKDKKRSILSFSSLSYSPFGWNDKTLKDILGVLSKHKLPEYSASTFTGFSPVLESVNTCFKASDLSVLTYYTRGLKFFSL